MRDLRPVCAVGAAADSNSCTCTCRQLVGVNYYMGQHANTTEIPAEAPGRLKPMIGRIELAPHRVRIVAVPAIPKTQCGHAQTVNIVIQYCDSKFVQ